MEGLLSLEHKITERRYMKYPPFGVDSEGNKIEDVRGHAIESVLDYVKELTRQKEQELYKDLPPSKVKEAGERAAKMAAERLISRLNGAIKDKKYHITEEILKNRWNSYSDEFFHFALEFAKEITGEKDFCLKLGMNKIITPLVAIIGKPIPLEYVYKLVDLEERFQKGCVKFEAPILTKGKATLRIRVTKKYKDIVGEYFLACAENTCQVRKGVIIAAPQRLHDMPPAQCRNIKCMAKGDEYCELEVTWELRPYAEKRLILLGIFSSIAVFLGLNLLFQCMALKFTLSILPLLIFYHLASRRRSVMESMQKEKLITEQQKYLEDRFKDLEDTTIRLQATNVELNERLHQLAEAQERLLHTEKLAALGRFSSYVSHELRNPLTSIKNVLFYFKKKLPQSILAKEDPRLLEFLEILDKEVDASANIINHILDFTKIKTPSLSKGDITNVLRHSLSRCPTPKGIKVLGEIPPNLPGVWIDSEQIGTVFDNVIKNAYEAMPQGGTLKITARTDGEFVEVEFADTGHGISEENLKKVFEPFFTSKRRGTGLGLSICKEIVERHRGSITLQSKLGTGSTFFVRLPVAVSQTI